MRKIRIVIMDVRIIQGIDEFEVVSNTLKKELFRPDVASAVACAKEMLYQTKEET